MKKKRKRRRKFRLQKKEKILIVVLGAVLVLLAVLIGIAACHHKTENRDEVRAVWFAYVDFKDLGLHNKSEKEFRKNAKAFFEKAEDYSINTVYFHVRAFRDATYKSKTFKMNRYLWDKEEEIPYDPLEIMIELAHKYGMELHAWLNPYRNYQLDQKILDPASQSSTEEILTCVEEVLTGYKVDGIHFDDYFYQEGSKTPVDEKKANVNRMIKSVYETVKSCGEQFQFGISPAGNVSYCESIGADVKTWLSEDGYVDYIAPQIYWTDEHSASWRDKMYSDTLDEWIAMNKNKAPLYVGLALYRTGEKADDDPGWGRADDNIAKQIAQLREKNCGGFALFSARDFKRKGAQKELVNYKQELEK